jgi:hypothetical protein
MTWEYATLEHTHGIGERKKFNMYCASTVPKHIFMQRDFKEELNQADTYIVIKKW